MTSFDELWSDRDRERMATHFAEHESEYRENSSYKFLYEDDDIVIFHETGVPIELNDWKLELETDNLVSKMNEVVEQVVEEDLNDINPLVFPKK